MTRDVLGMQNGGSRSGIDHEESYKQLDEMEQEKKKLGTINISLCLVCYQVWVGTICEQVVRTIGFKLEKPERFRIVVSIYVPSVHIPQEPTLKVICSFWSVNNRVFLKSIYWTFRLIFLWIYVFKFSLLFHYYFFSLIERRRDASSWQKNLVYPLSFLVLLLLTVSFKYEISF